jgi:hypothetical protein
MMAAGFALGIPAGGIRKNMTPINTKPCLCGSSPEIRHKQQYSHRGDHVAVSKTLWRIQCPACKLSTSLLGNLKIIIETWNGMDRPRIQRGKKMESATVSVKLPFNLTDAEANEVASRATSLMTTQDNMEEEYKVVKRDWNKKLKDIRLEARKACQVFAARIEEREVKAESCFDLKSGRCWYEYDGERYLERDITDEEKELVQQGTIFDDGANIPE